MYKLNAGRVFPLALALLLAAQPAFATDGYFSPGYGAVQQGHGGAGVAAPSRPSWLSASPPTATVA